MVARGVLITRRLRYDNTIPESDNPPQDRIVGR
jgi:hypothetical protein